MKLNPATSHRVLFTSNNNTYDNDQGPLREGRNFVTFFFCRSTYRHSTLKWATIISSYNPSSLSFTEFYKILIRFSM
jgi:hypothetical protein